MKQEATGWLRQDRTGEVLALSLCHAPGNLLSAAFCAEVTAALDRLATIVRGADTSGLDLTPQSAGLFAISLGLSHMHEDDHEMLKHGMVMYDALYAWCRSLTGETHNWPPKM